MLTTMDYQKTMQALKRLRVETGSLSCFGCGHEHNCSTQGCAILRNAVSHMEAALANYDHLSALTKQQTEDIQALERACTLTPPNEPLTCDGCACESYPRDRYPCNTCNRNNETLNDQYHPPEGEEVT